MKESLRHVYIWLLSILGLAEAVYVLLLRFNILYDYSCHSMTGTFSNPGPMGGFVAISLISMVGLFLLQKRWQIRTVLIPMLILGLIVVILSASRAALLAVFAGLFWMVPGVSNRKKLLMLIGIIAVMGIGLYFIRSESAKGRLMVWRVCWDMFLDKPVLGFGLDGLNKNYMLYQAEYFSMHPHSPFINNAANIGYAFNELIHILVNFGIVGLSLFICTIKSALHTCEKVPANRVIQSVIVAWLAFSMFSYPFSTAGLSLPFCIGLVLSEKCGRFKLAWECLCIAICLGFIIHHTNQLVNPNRATNYPYCEGYVETGDKLAKQGDTEGALQHYRIASDMIPLKLLPRYKMFLLLMETKDYEKADAVGNEIINLPVKIEGSESFLIKHRVKQMLKRRH